MSWCCCGVLPSFSSFLRASDIVALTLELEHAGDAFPKHAVNTSLYALFRHPWLHKVLERHHPHVHELYRGRPVCITVLPPGMSLAYYRLPPFDNRCRVGAGAQVA